MMIRLITTLALYLAIFSTHADQLNAVSDTLDRFHQAAAEADSDRYFALLTEDAIFLGTDASERWDKTQFQAFATPYFERGQGWTYRSTSRHIYFNRNNDTAWFDELLDNDNYGQCRGSGVLVRTSTGWKISQYHLVIPVPNSLAKPLVEQIRQLQSSEKP